MQALTLADRLILVSGAPATVSDVIDIDADQPRDRAGRPAHTRLATASAPITPMTNPAVTRVRVSAMAWR